MALELSLAPLDERADPRVELRGVYIEEWIEGLPYANPVALLRAYTEALAQLNRTPAKPALRLQLLELYLRPYLFLLELQRTQGPVHGIAVFERRRADTEAARQIAMELALGYKRVLSETAGKRSLFGGSREPRIALQRATLFLSHALLHSFDEYLPAPPELWRELHELHVFASERELLDAKAPAAGERAEFADGVDALYKRVLLTSLVDPYRLPYGDVWMVYDLFGAHATRARLGEPARPERPAGFFLLEPDRDFRPTSLAGRDALPGAPARMLDASAVREPLERRFAELQEGGVLTVRSGTEASLLGTMIRALGLPPKRHSPRERTEGRVQLATGLSSLHHFLGGEAPVLASAPAGEEEIDLSAEPAEDGGGLAAPEYSAEFWELIDQGPGGVGVIKRVRPNRAIGVGELIGIRFPARGEGADAGRWCVGVVRWLSIARAGEYQAGLQILSQDAEPVLVSPPAPPGDAPAPAARGAIALPSLGAAKGASLVAPTGTFDAAPALEIAAKGRRLALRPETLIESTGAYDRFTYALDA